MVVAVCCEEKAVLVEGDKTKGTLVAKITPKMQCMLSSVCPNDLVSRHPCQASYRFWSQGSQKQFIMTLLN